MVLKIMTALVATAAVLALAERPSLNVRNCDRDGCATAIISFFKYMPTMDLSGVEPFNKTINDLSYCGNGPWFHYKAQQFTGPLSMMFFTCSRLTNMDAQSFRFAGNPENFTLPSITMYEATSFYGEEYKLFDSNEDFRFTFNSLVVITNAYKFYAEPNFAGNFTCVSARPQGLPNYFQYNYAYNATREFGIQPGQVRSIEFVTSCN